MAMKPNYGIAAPMVAALMLLAIAIPVFLVGGAFFVKIVQLLFLSPIAKGSVPLWSIILMGMAVIIIFKRQRF